MLFSTLGGALAFVWTKHFHIPTAQKFAPPKVLQKRDSLTIEQLKQILPEIQNSNSSEENISDSSSLVKSQNSGSQGSDKPMKKKKSIKEVLEENKQKQENEHLPDINAKKVSQMPFEESEGKMSQKSLKKQHNENKTDDEQEEQKVDMTLDQTGLNQTTERLQDQTMRMPLNKGKTKRLDLN